MLNFPEDDSFSGFWTYVQSVSGDICIFALTPHVSDELYQAEVARLGKEHGYSAAQLAKIKKVAWPKDCKVGDSLEESVNVEGKGATLNAEYAAKKKIKAVDKDVEIFRSLHSPDKPLRASEVAS